MALDTTAVEQTGAPSPSSVPVRRRPGWLAPNVRAGTGGAVAGYAFGHWIGNVIASGYTNVAGSGQNDVAIALGLSIGVVGWLAGAGMLDYPLAKLVGREPLPPARRRAGPGTSAPRWTTRSSDSSTRSSCCCSSSPVG